MSCLTLRLEDVRKHDMVRTENPDTGLRAWERVERVSRRDGGTVEIRLKGGGEIVASNKDFVDVRRLMMVKP